MGAETSDGHAVALAMQDQTRAAAIDWLRRSHQFALSAFTTDSDGVLVVSSLGDTADTAAFLLTSIVGLWNALHEIAGETDAELVARLMAGVAISRQNRDD